MLEFSIISISAFVSVLNELTKTIANNCFKKSVNRYIPIFSLVYGVALATTGYYIPDVYFGNNIVEAIFIGLAAGGAAVGVHQTFHQLSKPSENAQHTLDDILSQKPEDESSDEESSDEIDSTITLYSSEQECEEPSSEESSDIESDIEESSDNTDEDIDED